MTRTQDEDGPFPVANMMARLRIQAAEKCRPGTTPQSLGLVFLLSADRAYGFLREYLFVMTGRQDPFLADLDAPLAIIDNMPVYCVVDMPPGGSIVDPRVIPPRTVADRVAARGIWGALARGAST